MAAAKHKKLRVGETMKVVIFAGGHGARTGEEATVIPKPLVEIGGRPILWHIMRLYAHHGLTEFVICCGSRGWIIKDYFLRYMRHNSDLTIDLQRNFIEIHRSETDPWKVTLVDTGETTMTGDRLRRVRELLGNSTFCLTYGDSVGDVDIGELIAYHRRAGVLVTVTAVRQPGRWGAINLSAVRPRAVLWLEQDPRRGQVVNGGFFVVEPEALDVIDSDGMSWEHEPLARLIEMDRLAVYQHEGYWQNMDSLRDQAVLQALWDSGHPPWCVWREEDGSRRNARMLARQTPGGR